MLWQSYKNRFFLKNPILEKNWKRIVTDSHHHSIKKSYFLEKQLRFVFNQKFNSKSLARPYLIFSPYPTLFLPSSSLCILYTNLQTFSNKKKNLSFRFCNLNLTDLTYKQTWIISSETWLNINLPPNSRPHSSHKPISIFHHSYPYKV